MHLDAIFLWYAYGIFSGFDYILCQLQADIDGATDIRDFDMLMLHMEHLEAQGRNGMYKGPAGIVLGSRCDFIYIVFLSFLIIH